jgi:hypothetical protein
MLDNSMDKTKALTDRQTDRQESCNRLFESRIYVFAYPSSWCNKGYKNIYGS